MEDKEVKPLEEWMLEKGLNQTSLASQSGFSQSLISKIITGKRNTFDGETMGAVAKVLNIEIRQIKEFDEAIKVKLGKETAPTSLQPINEVTSGAGSNTGAGVAALIPAQ